MIDILLAGQPRKKLPDQFVAVGSSEGRVFYVSYEGEVLGSVMLEPEQAVQAVACRNGMTFALCGAYLFVIDKYFNIIVKRNVGNDAGSIYGCSASNESCRYVYLGAFYRLYRVDTENHNYPHLVYDRSQYKSLVKSVFIDADQERIFSAWNNFLFRQSYSFTGSLFDGRSDGYYSSLHKENSLTPIISKSDSSKIIIFSSDITYAGGASNMFRLLGRYVTGLGRSSPYDRYKNMPSSLDYMSMVLSPYNNDDYFLSIRRDGAFQTIKYDLSDGGSVYESDLRKVMGYDYDHRVLATIRYLYGGRLAFIDLTVSPQEMASTYKEVVITPGSEMFYSISMNRVGI